ncbi:MAG: hypothetical protein GX167_09770 [Firmicutes bacterium]|nr:hypothetical protein [Bacillota bacterium]
MCARYGRLVFELPAEYNELVVLGSDTGFIKSPQAYFRGATQIPGANFNIGFQIFVKPFFLDRIPHRHDVDEYLIFLGGIFPNLFDFDAEIEFTIGKIGVDAEVYYITKPTVIRIPAGIYHCPINFKRVDKPVFFQAALMQDMFSSIYDTEDGGQKELWYNGPLPCRINSDKKCDCCRNCIEKDWR